VSAAEAVRSLTTVGVALPAALLALLGLPALLGRRVPERAVGVLTGACSGLSAAAFAAALVTLLAAGVPPAVLSFGSWFAAGESAFAMDLLVDRMSLAFAVAAACIAGMVAGFSHRYLHREPGYRRYFVQYAAFLLGMQLVVLAGSIEVLFAGWELIGLGSGLLVGFFHERPAPVRNALRVLVVYRLSDAAMLGAAILIHHLHGRATLPLLFGRETGTAGAVLTGAEATAIGLLLVLAAAGKCAQLPFSGWLPRAMEGPTPSSAVYYGALSVHAGAYLLLRAAPVLERSPLACVLLGLMGATTAVYAAFTRRVQTDVKSALAFASLTHVSVILVEIALGLHRIAFLHMMGNACLRLLQFLRAPSVLHDFHEARNAVGATPEGGKARAPSRLPAPLARPLYRLALERGYVEELLERGIVTPFLRAARAVDRAERRFMDVLAGSGRRV
jgi:NAD(P)H-quinone oxidoreductase subunit 5